jgi:hypothetical protein
VRLSFCRSRWFVTACLLVVTACHKPSPAAPEMPATLPLTGSWTGTIVDSVAGSGTVRLTIAQSTLGVTGDWMTTFQDAGHNKVGELSGTPINASIIFFLKPTPPASLCGNATYDGTMNVTGTFTSTHLTGHYVILTCTGVITGTIDAIKS